MGHDEVRGLTKGRVASGQDVLQGGSEATSEVDADDAPNDQRAVQSTDAATEK